jgi:hypothetical protein
VTPVVIKLSDLFYDVTYDCWCIRTGFILLRVVTKSKPIFIIICSTAIPQIMGYKITVSCEGQDLRPAAARSWLQECSLVAYIKALISGTGIQRGGLY